MEPQHGPGLLAAILTKYATTTTASDCNSVTGIFGCGGAGETTVRCPQHKCGQRASTGQPATTPQNAGKA